MSSTTLLRTALLASLLAGPAFSQNTYIVDGAGGPGSHFATIQAAIDSAQPGDRILVRPGTYPNFTLSKALTILGLTGVVRINNAPRVTAIPAGSTAALARLQVNGLRLYDAPGAVVLDSITQTGGDFGQQDFAFLSVKNVADVRILRTSYSNPSSHIRGLYAFESHVDLVECHFTGRDGTNSTVGEWSSCQWAGDGTLPVVVVGGSLYFAASSSRGGNGGDLFGDCDFCSPIPWAGDGAYGIAAFGGARVVLTGNNSTSVLGGSGGSSSYECGTPGQARSAVLLNEVGTQLRSSGVVLTAGVGWPHPPAVSVGSGASTHFPPLRDPSLALSGNVPAAGGTMRFVVHGVPGDIVTLLLARGPTRTTLSGSPIEQLTTEDFRPLAIGVVGAQNVTHLRPLPPGIQPGTLLVAQARILRGGQELRTNSVAFVVRE